MNNRIIAIDYVKFLAVLLVMNSHLDVCFVKYSFLSTGGVVGDALFFFASGFGLFLGRPSEDFFGWYKRRIRRIYPSIIASSIVAGILFGFHEDIIDVLLCKRYWFIGCILLYYILLYPIKTFAKGKYVNHLFLCWLFFCAISYFVMPQLDRAFYGGGYSRILFFFLFMLLGAIMGKNHQRFSFKWWYIPTSIVCLFLWAFLSVIGRGSWTYLLSVVPFLGFSAFAFLSFTGNASRRFYASKIGGNLVWIASQLCLECYLIQKFCYSDVLNFLFPLNIPIFMLIALSVAYLVKVVAEIILQTFDSKPYDWHKLLIYKKEN